MNAQDFIEAIKVGEYDKVVQALDQDAALLHARSDNGLSAVLVAAYYNEPDIVRLLVERGAELSLFEAATIGDLDRVKKWLEKQPDLLNAYAPDGFQPIGLAAFFGQTAIVEYLIGQGAEIDAPSHNTMRVRPLHSAVANRRTDIAKILIDQGADVNSVQADDFTPLHEAAQNGLLDVTQWLLERGAHVNARLSSTNQTPLTLAIEYHHEDVAELLRQQGGTD